MKDHPNPNVQAVSEPHSGPPDLDPSPVDTETPDVNQAAEACQVVEATTRDGQPITFAVHTLARLTSAEQAMLGQVAQAAAERMERENPHGGVLTELMLAAVHAQVVLRDAGKAQRADRLSAAVRAAADVIRAASPALSVPGWPERARRALAVADSAWGDATGDGDANPDYLVALAQSVAYVRDDELAAARTERDNAYMASAGSRELLVAEQAATETLRAELAELRERAETAIDLIDEYDGPHASFEDHPKWAAVREVLRGESEPAAWSCKCGMDVTDMVHTAERCYSAVKLVSEVDGVS